ncbi:MAG: hypothetical protein ACLGHX_12205 [Acidimicrobiia bacterium]
MYLTGSQEYLAAVDAERYGRQMRSVGPPRLAGIRSIERVVKLTGRGKEEASRPHAA